jgi:hypothetical protein
MIWPPGFAKLDFQSLIKLSRHRFWALRAFIMDLDTTVRTFLALLNCVEAQQTPALHQQLHPGHRRRGIIITTWAKVGPIKAVAASLEMQTLHSVSRHIRPLEMHH